MENKHLVDEIAELRKLLNDTNQLNIALYEKLEYVNKRLDDLEKNNQKQKVISVENKQDNQIVKVKKPRAPTAYNLFMKEKMLELKESHPHLSNIERMKMSAEAWEESKKQ